MDETNLLTIFLEQDPGRELRKCIQCGTCSGSCPLAGEMDHGPRELFALIREGCMRDALRSNTPWLCVSCYQCTARCPREIPITDLMYALKRLATREKLAPRHRVPELYRAFAAEIAAHGRVAEPLIMARYGLRRPLDAMASLPLAVKMLRRGRLSPRPQTTRQPDAVKKLLAGPPAGTSEGLPGGPLPDPPTAKDKA